MTIKGGSRRHRMKRGGSSGDGNTRPHGTNNVDLGDLHEMTDSSGKITLDLENQSGGRKSRRHGRHTKKHRRHGRKSRKTRRGGGVLATALLPFSLFGLQKYFQRNRTAKGLGNKVKSGYKNIKKLL